MTDEKDYKCSCKIYDVIMAFTKEEEGSYIPIHVASGRGFMRALADEISKHVELKDSK